MKNLFWLLFLLTTIATTAYFVNDYSYDFGYEDGYTQGKQLGAANCRKSNNYKSGHKEGFKKGFEVGLRTAYIEFAKAVLTNARNGSGLPKDNIPEMVMKEFHLSPKVLGTTKKELRLLKKRREEMRKK